VAVPVGVGLKAKQLDVVASKQHIRVGVKGQEPILDVSGALVGAAALRQSSCCRHTLLLLVAPAHHMQQHCLRFHCVVV
jgi:hypothetical protein